MEARIYVACNVQVKQLFLGSEANAHGMGGGRRTQRQPLSTGRGLGCRSRPEVGAGVQMMEADRGRKGPSDGSNPEAHRHLGAVQGR